MHPYWDQLAEVAERRFGVKLPYEQQVTWEIEHLTPQQVAECVAETHRAELVLSAEPYPGAVDVLAQWRAAGHTIHVASHRAPDAHDHTARWLGRIGVEFDELRCDYGKVDWAAEMGIGLLVDDSPVNLLRARDFGIEPATLRHPWNAELCAREGITCADTWAGLRDALEPLLGQCPAPDGADDDGGARG